jgi:hypothetical protein
MLTIFLSYKDGKKPTRLETRFVDDYDEEDESMKNLIKTDDFHKRGVVNVI